MATTFKITHSQGFPQRIGNTLGPGTMSSIFQAGELNCQEEWELLVHVYFKSQTDGSEHRMIIEQAALPYYFMIRKQFQCSAVNQPPQQWTIPAPNTNSECMDEIPDDTYDVKIESYFHVTGGSVWTHVIEHYCTNVVVDRTQPTSAEVCAYSETAQGTVWDPSYNWDEPTNWGLYIPYTKYVVAGLLAYGLTKEIVPTVIAIALAPVIGVAVGPLVEEELNKTNYLTSDDPEQQAMYNQLIVNAADGVAAAITAIIVMRIYQSASAKKQQRTVQKQTMFNPFAMQPYGYPVR